MKKRFFVSLVTMCLIAICTVNITGQQKSKKMSKLERIVSCQIPKKELKKISTPELLDKCLDYPYLNDILFTDNISLMFDLIKKEFNGYKEFFARKDAAEELRLLKNNAFNEKMNLNFQKVQMY